MTWPASFPILFRRRVPGEFGNSPAVSIPTKTPDEISGLTGWWDASDPTILFVDAGITPVSSDGDLVYRMGDKSGLAGNRYMEQVTAGTRMTYKVGIQNGLSVLRSVSTDLMVTIAISNFIANNEAFFFIALNLTSGTITQIFNDTSVYIGIQYNAGNAYLTNYAGAYLNTGNVAVPTGTPVVLCGWHSGGNIYIQKNNESPTSPVASGNTSSLGQPFSVFRVVPAGDLFECGTYNQPVSSDDRTQLVNGLMQKWGISG